MKTFACTILSFCLFLGIFLSCILLPAETCRLYAGEIPETQAGLDLVFVIDVSGSMVTTDPDRRLMEELFQYTESLSSDENRVGVVPFSDRLTENLPLTILSEEGMQTVGNYLKNLTYTDTDTDIGLGISAALDLFGDVNEASVPRRRRLLMVTDGIIDLPEAMDEQKAEKDSLSSALMAVEKAEDQGICIDAMGLGERDKVDGNLLGYMAERTGGSFIVTKVGYRLPELLLRLDRKRKKQMQPESAPQSEVQTETVTEAGTEAQTEEDILRTSHAETESEDPEDPAPPVIGIINDQVTIRGLLPSMCRIEINLHRLFDYSDSDQVLFDARASDMDILDCRIVEGTLYLTGRADGITHVTVTAKRDQGADNVSQADFTVRVSAYLNPGLLSVVLACLGTGAVISLIYIIISRGGGEMTGAIRYYVKEEGQKIFGVPDQSLIDLSQMGRLVRLSEIIHDSYLETADIGKVVIRATSKGMLLKSRTRSCLIEDEMGNAVGKLYLRKECRFRIVCATESKTAEIIAMYSSAPAYEEAEEEEKTRLLI